MSNKFYVRYDSAKIKIQIFCPIETLRVEYPTFIDQPVALANLLVEKEKIEQLIARMNEKPTIKVTPIYPQMQMNSLRNMMQKVMAATPKHNPSDAPITAIKYHPGTRFLNDQGTVPMHNLTVSKNQEVEVADGQCGSGMDEVGFSFILCILNNRFGSRGISITPDFCSSSSSNLKK